MVNLLSVLLVLVMIDDNLVHYTHDIIHINLTM